jgi:hypothetical protein
VSPPENEGPGLGTRANDKPPTSRPQNSSHVLCMDDLRWRIIWLEHHEHWWLRQLRWHRESVAL